MHLFLDNFSFKESNIDEYNIFKNDSHMFTMISFREFCTFSVHSNENNVGE